MSGTARRLMLPGQAPRFACTAEARRPVKLICILGASIICGPSLVPDHSRPKTPPFLYYHARNMSSIVDKLKEKLTTSDDQPGGNPQAGGAVTDPRGHDASKLPFSTKKGQNEQEFPGEVQGPYFICSHDIDLTRCRAFRHAMMLYITRRQHFSTLNS